MTSFQYFTSLVGAFDRTHLPVRVGYPSCLVSGRRPPDDCWRQNGGGEHAEGLPRPNLNPADRWRRRGRGALTRRRSNHRLTRRATHWHLAACLGRTRSGPRRLLTYDGRLERRAPPCFPSISKLQNSHSRLARARRRLCQHAPNNGLRRSIN